jgi:hypothetical protein
MCSAGAFTDAVGRAAALGFTDVVAQPPASSGYAGSEKALESVAGLLPRLRSL